MDEKDLAQAQGVADEKLNDVSGGRRILSACNQLNELEGGDETRDTVAASPAVCPAPAEAPCLDDEGEDARVGMIPHILPF